MKKIVIWGAGQGGRMMRNLLSSDGKVVAFCDNNEKMQGTEIDGVPVVAGEKLAEINPDYVYIAILNKEACIQVKDQIEKTGIPGEVINITEFRERFDIRLATLRLIAKEIYNRDIPGAIAELGVYQGEFASEINRIFSDRNLYLFDTFEGFDDRDLQIEKENEYSRSAAGKFIDTSEDLVRQRLPYPDRAIIRKGYFPHTAMGLKEKFALVSLDADLYQPMYEGLKFFYPRMSKGGYLILHDYNNSQFNGAGEAVSRYCRENGIPVVPLCDLHGSAVIVKA